MNLRPIFILILTTTLFSCTAQQTGKQYCAVAFYNTENLFDTIDDPDTYDEDFTPGGTYRYTAKVYQQKLHNIATVIQKLGTDKTPGGVSLIGLAEIENMSVLKDLTAQNELKKRNYKYISYNSPDARGIDVALLYQPKQFKPLKSAPYAVKNNGYEFTRDVLYVCGILNGDTIHILVNHWPSRREGIAKSAPKRAAAAMVNKHIVDSLMRRNINARIIIMGDMNDNPRDESISKVLHAYGNKDIEKLGFLYNPWQLIHKPGTGTSVYHREWDLFDQVIISDCWLHCKGWQYASADIFDEAFIRNDYKGADAYPKRSFKGNRWANGYSDHLPVVIYFSKN